jgi:lysophospholipase L1-like esterase
MKNYIFFFVILFLSINLHAQDSLIKVACVGNSITAGYGLSNPSTESYPAQMQKMFDSKKWMIENFGVSARTMLKTGDLPYWNEPQYKDALALNPNIVIIKLGTNDSKRWIWNKHGSEYKTDYKEMIQSFRNLSSKPEIFICLAIPGENRGWDIYNSYIKDSLNPRIKEVAIENGVNLIDLYNVFSGNEKAWLMGDSVHPNTAGCAVLAKAVKTMITAEKPNIKQNDGTLTTMKAVSYQWYLDNQPIPASNGGTSPSLKPTKQGFYKVSVAIKKGSESRLVSSEFLY